MVRYGPNQHEALLIAGIVLGAGVGIYVADLLTPIVGSHIMWAGNTCPGTTTVNGEEWVTVCGIMPMGPVLISLAAALGGAVGVRIGK